MAAIRISGSPRTAARQLIELLTRDNILDEDGNVNEATVEAACRYAGGPRTLDEWAEPELTLEEWADHRALCPHSPRSPVATAGSSPSSKNETPEPISEQCTQEESAPPADTSRSNSSAQDANTKGTHSPFSCRQN